MRTVVVLPTYNEADNIELMLDRITGSPIAPDVLVVDDSSPDGTGELVKAYINRRALATGDRVRLLTRDVKDGLGGAYRAGFAQALADGADRIVQMDADGSHPTSALAEMSKALDQGYTLAIGSRYTPGGSVADDWPLSRKMLSRAGNAYARTVLCLPGIRDLTGGFKMWDASLLARVDFGQANAAGYGFQIQTTLAALHAGARVVEVPILFQEREHGESKMSGHIVTEAMRAVLHMRPSSRAVPKTTRRNPGSQR